MTRNDDVVFRSATALSASMARGDIGVVEVLDAYLDRLDAFDGALRSHVSIDREGARRAALAAERELRTTGPRGPLHGIPVSHKDNLWTKGWRTTVHSSTSFDHVPQRDATAVARLRDAGTVFLGKTNTTEFACGDQLLHGDTPNPWGANLYSGASSAGSASGVAAGLTGVATGSDTGGSIRAPAALCGIVGVKPTYGRVSRFGLVPLSWSMDHVGALARSVQDAAHLVVTMAGHDPRDPSSDPRPVPAELADLGERLDGVRIGVPGGHFVRGMEPAVSSAMQHAHAQLEALGAILEPVDLPSAGDLAAAGSLLSMWEAFALHAATLRTEGRAYGPKARAHIASGAFHSSADVAHALQLRVRWAREVSGAFTRVDALVMPALPYAAVRRDAWVTHPPDTSWSTRAFSLTGHPALTLPCGADPHGRPIGLQVAARRFDERTMLHVGHAFERATEWHLRRPDTSWWRDPVPSTNALADVAPLDPGSIEAWRREADRLGLPLDDDDIARVHGLVQRVREGLRPLRLDRTIDCEPDLRFVPGGE